MTPVFVIEPVLLIPAPLVNSPVLVIEPVFANVPELVIPTVLKIPFDEIDPLTVNLLVGLFVPIPTLNLPVPLSTNN